jgi:hypothetical protein
MHLSAEPRVAEIGKMAAVSLILKRWAGSWMNTGWGCGWRIGVGREDYCKPWSAHVGGGAREWGWWRTDPGVGNKEDGAVGSGEGGAVAVRRGCNEK